VQPIVFESEGDFHLYRELRRYQTYDFSLDRDPEAVALTDVSGGSYLVKDVIKAYECQAVNGCKCDMFTVRVPDVSRPLVFTFLTKGGHEQWHPDSVDSACLEAFLLSDFTLNKDPKRKLDDFRKEILAKYPYQKGQSVFRGLDHRQIESVLRKVIKQA